MNHFETDPVIHKEVARRRTFAIISHPDAGKTTLTEKLLLYGGCLDVAGAVRGRKSQRAATSDWMELEKQRGISVSSTVLSFEFDNCRVNLLDTPGHHDFSEDTYRTLVAADCAVMVLDLAKGIESQTEKLFRVCALRKIPVLTFVNKVDRPGLEPLEILSEIEQKLEIVPVPMNWPIGAGYDFRGIVGLSDKTAHIFTEHDRDRRVAYESFPLGEAEQHGIPKAMLEQTQEEVELVEAAGAEYDQELFLGGMVSPVFFGSALTNYGVEHFLRGFLRLCPPPVPRVSEEQPVNPARRDFSGFVFKIQANLDPRHRDRIAFIRVCSGRFEREMEVFHPRTRSKIRLRRAHRLFGQERETVEEAYAGDIVGLINPGEFRLGDTLCTGEPVQYEGLPQFSPEHFAVLHCRETLRRKQFERGMEQLLEEGAIQVFHDFDAVRKEPILAAVGELQFDVVRYRLESEYNAHTEISWMPYKLARWVSLTPDELKQQARLPMSARVVKDQVGHTAVLFQSPWDFDWCARENPEVKFSPIRI